MPGITVGVYPGQQEAGTQVSSTGEGRHLTVREDELIHPYISDGFVNKGDPVVLCDASVPGTYGKAVGVAFASGAAIADLIAIDTEGIFNLLVYAEDDSGDSPIEIGDPLFIRAGGLIGAATGDGTGDAEISKIRNLVSQVPFGYALGSMEQGNSGVIAIKVHWDPEEQQDEFGIFQDGHGADDLKKFTLVDQDDNAAGMTRVVAIDGSFTAAKTGTAVFTGLAIDIAAGNDCVYVYGAEIYMAAVDNKTIGFLCGLSLYFEDQGNAISSYAMIDMGRVSVDAPATRDTYIRIREHGAAVLADSSFLLLEGANAVGYLLNFGDAPGTEDDPIILDNSTDGGGTHAQRIRVRIPGADRYIYLYAI